MGQKRRGNAWEVLLPFIIYYVVHDASLFILIFLCDKIMADSGNGSGGYMQANAQMMTIFISATAMIIGVLPLLPMLKRELAFHGDILYSKVYTKEKSKKTGIKITHVFLTIILALSASVGANILMTLTGFLQVSTAFQEVAGRQYQAVFGVGVIFYGLFSPIIEEIVFRGLVFNRLRDYYPASVAVLLSGILFGAYHGNLVQGVYGGCMGILIAYLYLRMDSFMIPCLFHAVANLAVYTLMKNEELYAKIFAAPNSVILLVILSAAFAAGVYALERLRVDAAK